MSASVREKVIASISLTISVGVAVADLVLDCLVASRWWGTPEFHAYAELVIIFILAHAVVPAFAMAFRVALEDTYEGVEEAMVLFVLFASNLHLPVSLFFALRDAWTDGSERRHFLGWCKFVEFFFACPQLALQSYATVNEYFGSDYDQVQRIVRASLVLGVVSIANFFATRWFESSLAWYGLAHLFFAAMLVARVAVFVAFFVEFGAFAWISVSAVFAVRAALARSQGHRIAFAVLASALLPISQADDSDVATRTVLHSSLAKLNALLYVLEISSLLLILVVLPSREHRADVSNEYLLVFGLLPMSFGLVIYAVTFVVEYDFFNALRASSESEEREMHRETSITTPRQSHWRPSMPFFIIYSNDSC